MSEFIIVKNNFPKKAAQLAVGSKAAEVVTAKEIESDAKDRAAVRTGFMQANIRARGNEVTANARYSGYVDKGTSKMAAEPFFEVSVRAARPKLEAELMALIKDG